MKTRTTILAAIALCALSSSAYAIYTVADRGTWPDSWPAELDALREQSRTFVGPLAPQPHYEIPFRTREEFEAAWPHILKVKSKGAPSRPPPGQARRHQSRRLDPQSPAPATTSARRAPPWRPPRAQPLDVHHLDRARRRRRNRRPEPNSPSRRHPDRRRALPEVDHAVAVPGLIAPPTPGR